MKNTIRMSLLFYFAISGIAFGMQSGLNEINQRSFSEVIKSELTSFNTEENYGRMRQLLIAYGIDKFKGEMIAEGHFTAEEKISADIKPFNPFARILAGSLKVAYSTTLLSDFGLESYSDAYFIAKNTPANDENWQNPDWAGKSSMSMHHEFLLIKDPRWSSFNVLTLGMTEDFNREKAIALLNEMETIALQYAKKAFDSTKVGLFFHVFPTNSVQTLHLHIVDMNNTGPSFHALEYKNLSLSAVRNQLLREQESFPRL